MNATLWAALRYASSQEIAKAHPVNDLHPNKLAVYRKACAHMSESFSAADAVTITRWAREGSRRVPSVPEQMQGIACACLDKLPEVGNSRSVIQPDLFSYPATTATETHWHVNFADVHLFGYYASGLFAQDEMQTAEIPILSHIREALQSLSREDPAVAPMTRHGTMPTPVCISGVERLVRVHTDPSVQYDRPYGLYGNDFARASQHTVNLATELLQPPVLTNILAMEAVKHGQGRYTWKQVQDVLETTMVGFTAARAHSKLISPSMLRTVIHTGHWGCGAFGGSRPLMALLQMAAARIAGVDIVYHAVDEHGLEEVQQGLDILQKLWEPGLKLHLFMERVVEQGFTWGLSNGT